MDGGESGVLPRPSLHSLAVEGDEVAGLVVDLHLTVVAVSPLARALLPGLATGTNLAKFVFLGQRPGPRSIQWQRFERQLVAMLRGAADRHRDDIRFRRVVGELCALSRVFAVAWATPDDVVPTGEIDLPNNESGSLALAYRALRHSDDDYDDIVFVFTPADRSARDALARLCAELPEAP